MRQFFVLGALCISCLAQAKVKNLILLIGDGMGPQQISLLYYYSKYASNKDPRAVPFAFEKLSLKGSMALSATEPFGKIVVDSACSATQLATGKASRSEMVGLGTNGNAEKTILHLAQEHGLATGIVTDTRVTHATPAGFVAHAPSRNHESDIAEQIIKVAPDVVMGGGVGRFLPDTVKNKIQLAPGFLARSRRGNSLDLIAMAKKSGYQVAFNKDQMLNIKTGKILGLYADDGMPDAIWQTENLTNSKRSVPNLLEMSKHSVGLLEKNKKGFFLMIEGGQIDWAGHNNDAGYMLHEMIQFNHTLNWLLSYVDTHPETLLVVTADHETGGFGFSYDVEGIPAPTKLSGKYFKQTKFAPSYDYGEHGVLEKLYNQKKSFIRLLMEFAHYPEKARNASSLHKQVAKITEFKFSLEAARQVMKAPAPDMGSLRPFYSKTLAMRASLISRSFAGQSGVVWASGGHTATPVNVFAYGPKLQRDQFRGYINHVKVGRLLKDSLGFN